MAGGFDFTSDPLHVSADFVLYRGKDLSSHTPVLAVTTAAEQPSPQTLRRLEHEYSLATELGAAWAAQPLALIRHRGTKVLILKDPGGEPLDWVIEQENGGPLDLTHFLAIAIGLASALG